MKNSSFIRDLLVKLLLIVIFIFLLMYLFPMPNLSPFYNSIFNDNVQTMKNAAEDYYTTERMPKEEGKSTKMTLQEMLDKKLVLPFVDKNNEACDAKKSYVEVTKTKDEYELKVSLTCGKESDYIIEKIGCYNFCPTGTCTLADLKKNDEEQKPVESTPVTTKTDKDGNVSVVVPNGSYIVEYEYVRNNYIENWTLGNWRNTTVDENENVRLAETRTQYTGQKKVNSGSRLYEQVSYGYRDNWSYDNNWTTEVKTETDKLKIWKTRTLYTGQKKVENKKTEYEHVKYGMKDNWTYDTDWTTEVKTQTDVLKLWKERTLYTGQKRIENKTTEYRHVKYKDTETWKETGWSTNKKKETSDVKLVGTRYTVSKDTTSTTTSCTNYKTDTNWYSSKPADTSTRKYDSNPVNSKTVTGNWKVINNSYPSRYELSTYEGNRWYEFLYSQYETCTYACNGQSQVRVFYYRVYERSSSKMYQYRYCTPKSSSSTTTDTQVVTDLKAWQDKGYKLVKTEYNYKVKTTTREVVDSKWTNSKTSPSGYEYSGDTRTNTTYTFVQLDKWVTNKDLLGEYTYNINTVKQYKYAHNNPTKYIEDTKWTNSKTSPAGYQYTGKSNTTTTVSFEPLNKYVTSYSELGEYTYNVTTKKEYKYKYNNPERYLKDTIWTTENVARPGYELTGNVKDTTKTTYIDLGYYVNSRSELGEYTYNVQSRTQYRYRYREVTNNKEYRWGTKNPGNGFEPTGNSRKTYVSGNRQK
ncbi:MAG: hypothetical protein IKF36_02715 [Bacilli bacterium]|nr:hypothetical protein [Bacilli bacterium]